MAYALGIDLGSSSVKASLLDVESGACVRSAFSPAEEMPILSPRPGFAEQDPQEWYRNACAAVRRVVHDAGISPRDVNAIGIAYQMHGLVLVDRDGKLLRPAIIWCDSRAVDYGHRAFAALGQETCLHQLLNSPGNFTAAKLAWVKEHEPEIYGKAHKLLLPGDWLALRLTQTAATTETGLSEGIFWDYPDNRPSEMVLDYFGFDRNLLAPTVPVFGLQGELCPQAADDLGLAAGTPVTYRAGDQPNNALALGATEPGDVAATAGTSGVVYAVGDRPTFDPQSRINRFLHVNHTAQTPRIGALLCINGTGILNSWLKRTLGIGGYEEMNRLAETVEIGCGGLGVLPFGNGAERILGNAAPGAGVFGLDLLRHGKAELCRAAQEGIVFAFRYGLEMLRASGVPLGVIKAGDANMFKSAVFAQAFASANAVDVELYETDGALGAARGACVGAGLYASLPQALGQLRCVKQYSPRDGDAYEPAYRRWREALEAAIKTS